MHLKIPSSNGGHSVRAHCINFVFPQRVRLSDLVGFLCWCTHYMTATLPNVQNHRWKQCYCTYNDVIKWKHFPHYWPFYAGNSPLTDEFPAQMPVTWELWCFLGYAPEPTIEQTLETPVFWDAIALIMTSLQWVMIAQENRQWNEADIVITFAKHEHKLVPVIRI